MVGYLWFSQILARGNLVLSTDLLAFQVGQLIKRETISLFLHCLIMTKQEKCGITNSNYVILSESLIILYVSSAFSTSMVSGQSSSGSPDMLPFCEI